MLVGSLCISMGIIYITPTMKNSYVFPFELYTKIRLCNFFVSNDVGVHSSWIIFQSLSLSLSNFTNVALKHVSFTTKTIFCSDIYYFFWYNFILHMNLY